MIELSTEIAGARIKVTGATAHELLAQLVDVEKSELALTVGRLNQDTEVPERMGRLLQAELVDEQDSSDSPASPASETVPSIVDSSLPPWARVVPGAPLVCGQPAWLVTGNNDGRPWTAFVHPSATIDRNLPETDDPDDPRLERGEARFRRFVR